MENSSGSENKQSISLPTTETLVKATKLSIKISKPVCFYFYLDSCRQNVSIAKGKPEGMDSGEEEKKIIYKNHEEHTSPILNIYKEGNEYIIVTRNTIYIINSGVKVTKIPDDLEFDFEEE